jgi:MoxR-like ATPase
VSPPDRDAAAIEVASSAAATAFADAHAALVTEIGKRIVGQRAVVDGVATALFAGSHVLLEGPPGLGKTLLVQTLAAALELSFSRVQFTPDLMPADVLGTHVLVEERGAPRLEFAPGPIFAHVVLADEINRATPKTQSALLEAMQEHAVTVGRTTRPLPSPFFVLATENPIEMEGTYPLPEAELDRFLLKLEVTPPTRDELHAILDRTVGVDDAQVRRVLDAERLSQLRRTVRAAPIARPVQDFAVRLVEASQPSSTTLDDVRRFVRYGSSPRGAQALVLAAKVRALREGRPTPSFDDVRAVAPAALRHRLLLNFDAEAEGVAADALVAALLRIVPEVP